MARAARRHARRGALWPNTCILHSRFEPSTEQMLVCGATSSTIVASYTKSRLHRTSRPGFGAFVAVSFRRGAVRCDRPTVDRGRGRGEESVQSRAVEKGGVRSRRRLLVTTSSDHRGNTGSDTAGTRGANFVARLHRSTRVTFCPLWLSVTIRVTNGNAPPAPSRVSCPWSMFAMLTDDSVDSPPPPVPAVGGTAALRLVLVPSRVGDL